MSVKIGKIGKIGNVFWEVRTELEDSAGKKESAG